MQLSPLKSDLPCYPTNPSSPRRLEWDLNTKFNLSLLLFFSGNPTSDGLSATSLFGSRQTHDSKARKERSAQFAMMSLRKRRKKMGNRSHLQIGLCLDPFCPMHLKSVGAGGGKEFNCAHFSIFRFETTHFRRKEALLHKVFNSGNGTKFKQKSIFLQQTLPNNG